MAQFDVYVNPNPNSQQHIPYLVDIQADLLDHLSTRVVAPLYRQGNIVNLLQQLNPIITMKDKSFILSIAELAAIPFSSLGAPISNTHHERESIMAAVDLLITGI